MELGQEGLGLSLTGIEQGGRIKALFPTFKLKFHGPQLLPSFLACAKFGEDLRQMINNYI
jgi:hypothetical protein